MAESNRYGKVYERLAIDFPTIGFKGYKNDFSEPDHMIVQTTSGEMHVLATGDDGSYQMMGVNASPADARKHHRKGRFVGFLAFALTLAYAIYIAMYFRDVSMETLSGFVATSIVMPHLVCVFLSVIFSAVGLFGWKRWGMLVAGILLSVSAALMLTYLPMVVVQAILCFIAYIRMK